MSKKKDYFPNNWEAYSEADAELFESLPFDQFMDWKVAGWELPSSVTCIIREKNLRTGKIKEHVYQRRHAANKKIKQLMLSGHKFTIIDHEHCELVDPTFLEYDDPLA